MTSIRHSFRSMDPITSDCCHHPVELDSGYVVDRGHMMKRIGEAIDPALEQQWLNEYYQTVRPIHGLMRPIEDYRDAYHYGLTEKVRRRHMPFEKIEDALEDEWDNREGSTLLQWDEIMPAVRHAYNRPLPFNKRR